MEKDQEIQCCPKFDPSPWDGKLLEWKDKKFILDKVFTLLYMPLNFGQVMTRLTAEAEKAEAKTPDNLCLCDHTSKWRMDLYLAVDKQVPGAKNVALGGKFFCKVYEGDFKDTGKWCKNFEGVTKELGYKIDKQFMWYTTCPKCARKYGKNYTVIVGRVG